MNQLFGRTTSNRSGNRRGMGRALSEYMDAWERLRDVDQVAECLGVERKACRARLRQLGCLEPTPEAVEAKRPTPTKFRCPSCSQIRGEPVCPCGEVINPTLAAGL